MQQPTKWPQDISKYVDTKSPIFKYLLEIEKKHWNSQTNAEYRFPKRQLSPGEEDSEDSIVSLSGVAKYALASQNKSPKPHQVDKRVSSQRYGYLGSKLGTLAITTERKGSPDSSNILLKYGGDVSVQENSLKPFQITSLRGINGAPHSPSQNKPHLQVFNASARNVDSKLQSSASKIKIETKVDRKPVSFGQHLSGYRSEMRGGRVLPPTSTSNSHLRQLGSKREGRIKLLNSELVELSHSRVEAHTSANFKDSSSWKIYSKRELGTLQDQWRLLQQKSVGQFLYPVSGKAILNSMPSHQAGIKTSDLRAKDSPESSPKHNFKDNGLPYTPSQVSEGKKLALSTSYAGFNLKSKMNGTTSPSELTSGSQSQKLLNTIKLFKPSQPQSGELTLSKLGRPAALKWAQPQTLEVANSGLRATDLNSTDVRRPGMGQGRNGNSSTNMLTSSQSNTYLVTGQRLKMGNKVLEYSTPQAGLKKLSEQSKLKSTMKILAIKDANLLAATKQRLVGKGDALLTGHRPEDPHLVSSNPSGSLYAKIRTKMTVTPFSSSGQQLLS